MTVHVGQVTHGTQSASKHAQSSSVLAIPSKTRFGSNPGGAIPCLTAEHEYVHSEQPIHAPRFHSPAGGFSGAGSCGYSVRRRAISELGCQRDTRFHVA